MKVLVSGASKYGSTAEVAAAIGEELQAQGVDAEVRAPTDVDTLDNFDAAVLGSGVYAGHWLEPAKTVIERHGEALRGRPVWLFSVGPVGEPPKPDEEPVDVARPLDATKAREHRIFAGRLDRSRLSFVENAIVIALRAPEGDFRDWDAIRAWARDIAKALETPA
jgi:menaquinone-dependent protoporphyrinogen oxidase